MIVNPYDSQLDVFEGTRLLKRTFGLIGKTVQEPSSDRRWVIHGLYAPLPKRVLGGIRAKLISPDGITTFINQRDLEVLLGDGIPGASCRWLNSVYPQVGEDNWFGFCMDTQDLLDDLMDHELMIRLTNGGKLPPGSEIQRTVHTDKNTDTEEIFVSTWDINSEAGIAISTGISTIHNRWTRSYNKRVI